MRSSKQEQVITQKDKADRVREEIIKELKEEGYPDEQIQTILRNFGI